MSQSVPSPQQQEPSASTVTLLETTDEQDHAVPKLTLKLKKAKTDRKVQWSTETVDNEHLGRKKSKCCCIFNKPRKFDESSSDSSDDECEHCQGHREKRKKAHGREETQTEDETITLVVDNPIPNSGDSVPPSE